MGYGFGVKLHSYASLAIEGAMLDYLRGLDLMSRDDRRKYKAAVKRADAENLPGLRSPAGL